jgi:hypothetical protein
MKIEKTKIDVKRGGYGLANRWFYRFVGELPDGIREGRWSDVGYRTKREATAAADDVRVSYDGID